MTKHDCTPIIPEDQLVLLAAAIALSLTREKSFRELERGQLFTLFLTI
jgi:hypothetical protein